MELKMANKPKAEQTASPTKYPQGYFKDKPCKRCKSIFSPVAPSEHYCSDSCKDDALRDNYLYRNYGISLNAYKELLEEQHYTCAICGKSGEIRAAANNSVPLVVDHSHTTGTVRGLLCHTCNSALGQFQDSVAILKKAIEYLETPKKSFTSENRKLRKRAQTESLAQTTVLNILIDSIDNKLSRKEIIHKYEITEAKARGVIELKTTQAKKAFKRYKILKERATTIPNGSTPEANAGGSGQHPTSEGEDIVSSI